MSVITVSVFDDWALIGGDGVCTDPRTGNVAGYMSKISLLPHISSVLACTGIGGFDLMMQWHMCGAVKDFDDLTDKLPELVRYTHAHALSAGLISPDMIKACVAAVGWSERSQRMEGYRIVTYDKMSNLAQPHSTDTLEPWVLHPLPRHGAWGTTGKPELVEKFGLRDEEIDDPIERTVRFVCAARADSGIPVDGTVFNAGGFIELATVAKHQVQSAIVHHWPEDVPGKVIDPSLGEPIPPQYRRDRDHVLVERSPRAETARV